MSLSDTHNTCTSPSTPRRHSAACKCCTGTATHYGTVDFSKNCEERAGLQLQPSDWPITYYRCNRCGLIFTKDFDSFSNEDFKKHIYNADYARVDPEIGGVRAHKTAKLLANIFGHARSELRVLDYGSGDGSLLKELSDAGFKHVEGYDPFLGSTQAETPSKPEGTFDLVVCVEVMEHSADPQALVKALIDLKAASGIILYTTLLQPDDIETIGLGWWYVAPRNGHITLYSKDSLLNLWSAQGMRHASANTSIHLAYTNIPEFAKHLF